MRPKSLLRRRPSAAMVIAALALFVSLGGVGYAATLRQRQRRHAAAQERRRHQQQAEQQLRRRSGRSFPARSGSCGPIPTSCRSGSAATARRSGDRHDREQRQGQLQQRAARPDRDDQQHRPPSRSSPATVDSTTLASGSSYLALANPTATVTGSGIDQRVNVSCTLTVGSNTETRGVTIDTGTSTSGTSVVDPAACRPAQAGTASVSCQTTRPADPGAVRERHLGAQGDPDR